MHETEQDLAELQELLERTLVRANPHLTSIVSPERRLTARQVARYLQGTKHVAFATVNERGEPLGSSPFEWGEGVVFMRIEPSSMWAYAFHPDRFPD